VREKLRESFLQRGLESVSGEKERELAAWLLMKVMSVNGKNGLLQRG